jgi:hypothetical protein
VLKLMNLRPDEVYGTDPWTGEDYTCAARPGTVEVNERLGRNLAKQEENWKIVEDDKPKRGKAADEEKS